MSMFNDLFELLADVPLTLVASWLAWLGTGALIVMWFRRAGLDEPAPAPRAVSKPKPASRPASTPDPHATTAAAEAPVATEGYGPAPGLERAKGPVVIGDPFGDLATLLDQPSPSAVATEYTPPPTAPRAPAESPILSSAGSPMRPQIRHRLDTD